MESCRVVHIFIIVVAAVLLEEAICVVPSPVLAFAQDKTKVIASKRVKDLLDRKPFRPFRLFLADGSHHDVPHPEFAWVFGGRVFVGVPANGSPDGDGRVKELAVLHLTRIEDLASRKRKK
jgi:hypothetical protein